MALKLKGVVLPAVLLSLILLCEPKPENPGNGDLILMFVELKSKVVELESILEETTRSVNAKSLYLEQQQNLIDDMDVKISELQYSLSTVKDFLDAQERLRALKQEVPLLWAVSRKNNFDIHVLESQIQDAEARLESVTSQVEKMNDIVIEQWIQIQQLEQALHMTEMRTLKARKKRSSSRCTLLKFVHSVSHKNILEASGMPYFDSISKRSITIWKPLGCHTWRTCLSDVFRHFNMLYVRAKKYHHELQRFVKIEMDRNEFTAALANEELVFFVASALITFPFWGGWFLLVSRFQSPNLS